QVSGYAMRADRLAEVEYRWKIADSLDSASVDDEVGVAFLLAYIIGLDFKCYIRQVSSVGDDFRVTNWPSNKGGGGGKKDFLGIEDADDEDYNEVFRTPVSNISIFQYFKKFLDPARVPRKNDPQKPDQPRYVHKDVTLPKRPREFYFSKSEF